MAPELFNCCIFFYLCLPSMLTSKKIPRCARAKRARSICFPLCAHRANKTQIFFALRAFPSGFSTLPQLLLALPPCLPSLDPALPPVEVGLVEGSNTQKKKLTCFRSMAFFFVFLTPNFPGAFVFCFLTIFCPKHFVFFLSFFFC